MRPTFQKAERLSSRKLIDRLFKRGSTEVQTFYLFPFRVLYICEVLVTPDGALPTSLPAILITVSKRNFKRAVDRNLLRRRVREAYRLNKVLLLTKANSILPTYITFIYTAKQQVSFEEIEKGMKLALKKFSVSSS